MSVGRCRQVFQPTQRWRSQMPSDRRKNDSLSGFRCRRMIRAGGGGWSACPARARAARRCAAERPGSRAGRARPGLRGPAVQPSPGAGRWNPFGAVGVPPMTTCSSSSTAEYVQAEARSPEARPGRATAAPMERPAEPVPPRWRLRKEPSWLRCSELRRICRRPVARRRRLEGACPRMRHAAPGAPGSGAARRGSPCKAVAPRQRGSASVS